MKNEKTHIDLFSGIGGFALAAGWAGFRTVAFCENEPFPSSEIRRNWPNAQIISDIRGMDGTQWRGHTLLTAGFPCPAFSRAGKQGGFSQDELFYQAIRIIRESKPRWVIFENVEGFTKWADTLHREVENIGYEWEDAVLDARDFGIPQARKRYFAVCLRGGVLSGSQYIRRLQGDEGSDIHRTFPNYPYSEGRWTSPGKTKDEWREIFAHSRRSGNSHGIPHRMDRLKVLGNAIVPQAAYEIIRCIAEL